MGNSNTYDVILNTSFEVNEANVDKLGRTMMDLSSKFNPLQLNDEQKAELQKYGIDNISKIFSKNDSTGIYEFSDSIKQLGTSVFPSVIREVQSLGRAVTDITKTTRQYAQGEKADTRYATAYRTAISAGSRLGKMADIKLNGSNETALFGDIIKLTARRYEQLSKSENTALLRETWAKNLSKDTLLQKQVGMLAQRRNMQFSDEADIGSLISKAVYGLGSRSKIREPYAMHAPLYESAETINHPNDIFRHKALIDLYERQGKRTAEPIEKFKNEQQLAYSGDIYRRIRRLQQGGNMLAQELAVESGLARFRHMTDAEKRLTGHDSGMVLGWNDAPKREQIQYFLARALETGHRIRTGQAIFERDADLNFNINKSMQDVLEISNAFAKVAQGKNGEEFVKRFITPAGIELGANLPKSGSFSSIKHMTDIINTVGRVPTYAVPYTTLREGVNGEMEFIPRETKEEMQKVVRRTGHLKTNAKDKGVMLQNSQLTYLAGLDPRTSGSFGKGYDAEGKSIFDEHPPIISMPVSEIWAKDEEGYLKQGKDKVLTRQGEHLVRAINNGARYNGGEYSYVYSNGDAAIFMDKAIQDKIIKSNKEKGIDNPFEGYDPTIPGLVVSGNLAKTNKMATSAKRIGTQARRLADIVPGVNFDKLEYGTISLGAQKEINEMLGTPALAERLIDGAGLIDPSFAPFSFQARGLGEGLKGVFGNYDWKDFLRKTVVATPEARNNPFIRFSRTAGGKEELSSFYMPTVAFSHIEKKDEREAIVRAINEDTEYKGMKRAELLNEYFEDVMSGNIGALIESEMLKTPAQMTVKKKEDYENFLRNNVKTTEKGKSRYLTAKEASDRLAQKQARDMIYKDKDTGVEYVRLNREETDANIRASLAASGGLYAVKSDEDFNTNKRFVGKQLAEAIGFNSSMREQSARMFAERLQEMETDEYWINKEQFSQRADLRSRFEQAEDKAAFVKGDKQALQYIQSQKDALRAKSLTHYMLPRDSDTKVAFPLIGSLFENAIKNTGASINENSSLSWMYSSMLSNEDYLKNRFKLTDESLDMIKTNGKIDLEKIMFSDAAKGVWSIVGRTPSALNTFTTMLNLASLGASTKDLRGGGGNVALMGMDAIYRMNTGDFDGDTVWTYALASAMSKQSLNKSSREMVDNLNKYNELAQIDDATQKEIDDLIAQQMEELKGKQIPESRGEREVERLYSYMSGQGEMGKASALMRNALDLYNLSDPGDRQKFMRAYNLGSAYYDKSTSEGQTMGWVGDYSQSIGKAAYMASRQFSRFQKMVAENSLVPEEERETSQPSIFKHRLKSLNNLQDVADSVSAGIVRQGSYGSDLGFGASVDDWLKTTYGTGSKGYNATLFKVASDYGKILKGQYDLSYLTSTSGLETFFNTSINDLQAELGSDKITADERERIDQELKALTRARDKYTRSSKASPGAVGESILTTDNLERMIASFRDGTQDKSFYSRVKTVADSLAASDVNNVIVDSEHQALIDQTLTEIKDAREAEESFSKGTVGSFIKYWSDKIGDKNPSTTALEPYIKNPTHLPVQRMHFDEKGNLIVDQNPAEIFPDFWNELYQKQGIANDMATILGRPRTSDTNTLFGSFVHDVFKNMVLEGEKGRNGAEQLSYSNGSFVEMAKRMWDTGTTEYNNRRYTWKDLFTGHNPNETLRNPLSETAWQEISDWLGSGAGTPLSLSDKGQDIVTAKLQNVFAKTNNRNDYFLRHLYGTGRLFEAENQIYDPEKGIITPYGTNQRMEVSDILNPDKMTYYRPDLIWETNDGWLDMYDWKPDEAGGSKSIYQMIKYAEQARIASEKAYKKQKEGGNLTEEEKRWLKYRTDEGDFRIRSLIGKDYTGVGNDVLFDYTKNGALAELVINKDMKNARDLYIDARNGNDLLNGFQFMMDAGIISEDEAIDTALGKYFGSQKTYGDLSKAIKAYREKPQNAQYVKQDGTFDSGAFITNNANEWNYLVAKQAQNREKLSEVTERIRGVSGKYNRRASTDREFSQFDFLYKDLEALDDPELVAALGAVYEDYLPYAMRDIGQYVGNREEQKKLLDTIVDAAVVQDPKMAEEAMRRQIYGSQKNNVFDRVQKVVSNANIAAGARQTYKLPFEKGFFRSGTISPEDADAVWAEAGRLELEAIKYDARDTSDEANKARRERNAFIETELKERYGLEKKGINIDQFMLNAGKYASAQPGIDKLRETESQLIAKLFEEDRDRISKDVETLTGTKISSSDRAVKAIADKRKEIDNYIAASKMDMDQTELDIAKLGENFSRNFSQENKASLAAMLMTGDFSNLNDLISGSSKEDAAVLKQIHNLALKKQATGQAVSTLEAFLAGSGFADMSAEITSAVETRSKALYYQDQKNLRQSEAMMGIKDRSYATRAEDQMYYLQSQKASLKSREGQYIADGRKDEYDRMMAQYDKLESKATPTQMFMRDMKKGALSGITSPFKMLAAQFQRRLIFGAINEVKSFVKQFDAAMTQIQMITLKSDEQISKLGSGLIDKAKELKISVADISNSAVTLYRQGLSDQEVNERLEVVSKFSKVSGTKIDDATKLITVAMNTGLVTDATYASDVVTALGDNAATNAAQIEKGIEKAGAAAAADGTSFGQLAAMLTAITSTTQIGGSVAGRTINTIMGRMNKIGTNELIYDENGNAISGSAVAKLLKAQGINMYDKAGNKRSTFDVLYDLSEKWEGMSDAEQQQIATAIAGTRQYSNFAAIMQGMHEGKIDEYMDLIGEASGITDKKYQVYTESLAASLTNLKNTFDELVADLTNSKVLTGFFDGISKAIQGIDNLANSFGGAYAAASPLIGVLAGMGMMKMGMTMGAAGVPLLLGGLAVSGVSYGLAKLNGNGSKVDPKKEYEEYVKTSSEKTKAEYSDIDRARTLVDKEERTPEEDRELNRLLTKLKNRYNIDIDELDKAESAENTNNNLVQSSEKASTAVSNLADSAMTATANLIEFGEEIVNKSEEQAEKRSYERDKQGVQYAANNIAKDVNDTLGSFYDEGHATALVGRLWKKNDDGSFSLINTQDNISETDQNKLFTLMANASKSGAFGEATGLNFDTVFGGKKAFNKYTAADWKRFFRDRDLEFDFSTIFSRPDLVEFLESYLSEDYYSNDTGQQKQQDAFIAAAKEYLTGKVDNPSDMAAELWNDYYKQYGNTYVTGEKVKPLIDEMLGFGNSEYKTIDEGVAAYKEKRGMKLSKREMARSIGLEYLGDNSYYVLTDENGNETRLSVEEAKNLLEHEQYAAQIRDKHQNVLYESHAATYGYSDYEASKESAKQEARQAAEEGKIWTYEAADGTYKAFLTKKERDDWVAANGQYTSGYYDEDGRYYSFSETGEEAANMLANMAVEARKGTAFRIRNAKTKIRNVEEAFGSEDEAKQFAAELTAQEKARYDRQTTDALRRQSDNTHYSYQTLSGDLVEGYGYEGYSKTSAARREDLTVNPYILMDAQGNILGRYESEEEAEAERARLTKYIDSVTGETLGTGEAGAAEKAKRGKHIVYYQGTESLGEDEEGEKARNQAIADYEARVAEEERRAKNIWTYTDLKGDTTEFSTYGEAYTALEQDSNWINRWKEAEIDRRLTAAYLSTPGGVITQKDVDGIKSAVEQEADLKRKGLSIGHPDVKEIEKPHFWTSEYEDNPVQEINDNAIRNAKDLVNAVTKQIPELEHVDPAIVYEAYGKLPKAVQAVLDGTQTVGEEAAKVVDAANDELLNKVKELKAYRNIFSSSITTGYEQWRSKNQNALTANSILDAVLNPENKITDLQSFVDYIDINDIQKFGGLLKTEAFARLFSTAVIDEKNAIVQYEPDKFMESFINLLYETSSFGKKATELTDKAAIAQNAYDLLTGSVNGTKMYSTLELQQAAYDDYVESINAPVKKAYEEYEKEYDKSIEKMPENIPISAQKAWKKEHNIGEKQTYNDWLKQYKKEHPEYQEPSSLAEWISGVAVGIDNPEKAVVLTSDQQEYLKTILGENLTTKLITQGSQLTGVEKEYAQMLLSNAALGITGLTGQQQNDFALRMMNDIKSGNGYLYSEEIRNALSKGFNQDDWALALSGDTNAQDRIMKELISQGATYRKYNNYAGAISFARSQYNKTNEGKLAAQRLFEMRGNYSSWQEFFNANKNKKDFINLANTESYLKIADQYLNADGSLKEGITDEQIWSAFAELTSGSTGAGYRTSEEQYALAMQALTSENRNETKVAGASYLKSIIGDAAYKRWVKGEDISTDPDVQRKLRNARYGFTGLTTSEKQAGIGSIMGAIRSGTLLSDLQDETKRKNYADYMSGFANWEEYQKLVTAQGTSEFGKLGGAKRLGELNHELELFQKNSKIEFEVQGIDTLEEAGEVLEGTKKYIEAIKKGGKFEIDARLKFSSDLYEQAQLDAMLASGNTELVDKAVQQITGVTGQRYYDNRDYLISQANLSRTASRTMTAETLEKEYQAAVKEGLGEKYLASLVGTGWSLGEAQTYQDAYGNIQTGRRFIYNPQDYVYENPYAGKKQEYTEADLYRMRQQILNGTLKDNEVGYKEADESGGRWWKEYRRRLASSDEKVRASASNILDNVRAEEALTAEEVLESERLENARLKSGTLGGMFAYADLQYQQSNKTKLAANRIFETLSGAQINSAEDLLKTLGNPTLKDSWKELLKASPDLAKKFEDLGIKVNEDGTFDVTNMNMSAESAAAALNALTQAAADASNEYNKHKAPDTTGETYQMATDYLKGNVYDKEDEVRKFNALRAVIGDEAAEKVGANLQLYNANALPYLEEYKRQYDSILAAPEYILDEEAKQEALRNLEKPAFVPDYGMSEENSDYMWTRYANMKYGQNGLTDEQRYDRLYDLYRMIGTESGVSGVYNSDMMKYYSDALSGTQYATTYFTAQQMLEDYNKENNTNFSMENLGDNVQNASQIGKALQDLGIDYNQATELAKDFHAELAENGAKVFSQYKKGSSEIPKILGMLAKGGKDAAQGIALAKKQAQNYQDHMTALDKLNKKSLKGKARGKTLGKDTLSFLSEMMPEFSADDLAKMTIDELRDMFKDAGAEVQKNAADDYAKYFENLHLEEKIPLDQLVDINADGVIDTSEIEAQVGSQLSAAQQNILAAMKAYEGVFAKAGIDVVPLANGIIQAMVTVEGNGKGKYHGGGGGGGGGGESDAQKMLKRQKREVADVEHEIKMQEIYQTHYDFVNDYDHYIESLGAEESAYLKLNSVYQRHIAELESSLAGLEEYSDDWYSVKDALDAAKESLADVQNKIDAIETKRVEIILQKQENEDKPSTQKQSLWSEKARGYQVRSQFESYAVAEQQRIKEIDEQRKLNEEQIKELENVLNQTTENSDAWIQARDKIWELQVENAKLANDQEEARRQLELATIQQAQNDLTNRLAPREHEQNMLETFGQLYQTNKQWDDYRSTLRQNNEVSEQNVDLYRQYVDKITEQMSALEEGSEAWYTAREAIFSYEEAIAKATVSIDENNRAIEQNKVDELKDKYDQINKATSHTLNMLKTQQDRFDKNNNFTMYQAVIGEEIDETVRNIANLEEQLQGYIDLSGELTEDSDAWRANEESARSTAEQIENAKNQLEEYERLRSQSKFEHDQEVFQRQNNLDEHQLKMMQYYESKYQNRGELTNVNTMLGIENEQRLSMVDRLNDYINALKEDLALTEEGSDEYYKIADAIYKAEEQVENHTNAVEKNTETIKKNEEAILKTHKSLVDLIDTEIRTRVKEQREMLSAEVSIQNQILNIIRNRYKKEWDLVKADINEKKKALQEEKALIDERLRAYQNAEDREEKYQQISELQRQISIISSDPTRTKDLKDLQKKLDDMLKEQARTLAQEEASASKKRLDDEAKALDEYMAYNEQKLNEMLKDANSTALFEELNAVMGDDSMSREDRLENYLNFIRQNDDNYKYGTEAMRAQLEQQNTDSLNKMVGFVDTYWDEVHDIIDGGIDRIISYMKESSSYRNAENESGQALLEIGWKNLYEAWVDANVDNASFDHTHDIVTEIEDEVTEINKGIHELDGRLKEWYDLYQYSIKYDYIRPTDVDPDADKIDYRDYAGWGRKPPQIIASTGGGSGGGGSGSGKSSSSGKKTEEYLVYGGTDGETIVGKIKASSPEEAAKKWQKQNTKSKAAYVATVSGKTTKVSGFASGGLVDYTGPAWVDGTKTRPEAFLDATDTVNIRSMLDAFNVIKTMPMISPGDRFFGGNNQTIGDVNIVINQAELKSDADLDKLATEIGRKFTKELSKEGFNLASYAW